MSSSQGDEPKPEDMDFWKRHPGLRNTLYTVWVFGLIGFHLFSATVIFWAVHTIGFSESGWGGAVFGFKVAIVLAGLAVAYFLAAFGLYLHAVQETNGRKGRRAFLTAVGLMMSVFVPMGTVAGVIIWRQRGTEPNHESEQDSMG